MNILLWNRRRSADWPYSDREMALVRQAVAREANPPARRTGVGPLVPAAR